VIDTLIAAANNAQAQAYLRVLDEFGLDLATEGVVPPPSVTRPLADVLPSPFGSEQLR
jgi:hypothetical protein